MRFKSLSNSINSFDLKLNKMTSMKYTGKPVIKQLFSILDTLFSLGNYIHALNSKSVASFPFGIGDSLVLGYTPSFVSHSSDRKFLLFY